MNRYNKMAKIKRLRCNLMKLTPQGMMNDKANVFKDENQLSHTLQKCLQFAIHSIVSVKNGKFFGVYSSPQDNWTIIQTTDLKYSLPRNVCDSKILLVTTTMIKLDTMTNLLPSQVMGNRGKFTLHKNGLIFLKEGNSSILSTVTIHSFQEIEGIV